MQTTEQFAQLLRYVARNPVRAGLAAHPAGWPWSSHAGTVSRSHPFVDTARVTELLESYGGDPVDRYSRLLESDGPLSHIDADISPWRLRPSLGEIFATCDLGDAARSARAYGYRLAEIGAHVGVSAATVSRWTKAGA